MGRIEKIGRNPIQVQKLQVLYKYWNGWYIILIFYINDCLVGWYYSWENKLDPLCCQNFSRNMWMINIFICYVYGCIPCKHKCLKSRYEKYAWASHTWKYEHTNHESTWKTRWDPFTWRQFMGPSLWRQLNRQDAGPFTWRQLFESLPVKAIKTIGSLYIWGSWPAESLQYRGTWVPLQVSTVWRQSRVELTPRSCYPRAAKIKSKSICMQTL